MSGALRKLKQHIHAVKNINKITASMKAVSAAKFAKSEKGLRLSRPLGQAAHRFYSLTDFDAEKQIPHMTFVAVTSDRGLCGSMHSKVCRSVIKNSVAIAATQRTYDIVCLGEKAKTILSFENSEAISLVVNGIGHTAPIFKDASVIVERVFKRDPYVQGQIVFPLFKNMVEYNVSLLKLYTLPFLLSSKAILPYEFETDDFLSYSEFTQVILLYFAMCETYLVELAQRITTMSNAASNSKSMSSKLVLAANRKRQQLVTSELIDIVSGAQVIGTR